MFVEVLETQPTPEERHVIELQMGCYKHWAPTEPIGVFVGNFLKARRTMSTSIAIQPDVLLLIDWF